MKEFIKRGIYYFRKSARKNKKYDVFKKVDGELKKITSFGDNRYEQFKDKLGLYKHLDHGDKKRKDAYYARHGDAKFESAKYFSHKYLW